MSSPVQNLQSPELGICVFLIYPADEVLKMYVNTQGPWFVNKLKPAFKLRDKNRPASTMCVSRPSHGLRQVHRVGRDIEEPSYFIPIDSDTLKKFSAIADPILNGASQ